MEQSNKMINVIAPALRALASDGGRMKIVTFQKEDMKNSDSCIDFALPESEEPHAVVEALREALAGGGGAVKAVKVKDVGVFQIDECPVASGRAAGKVAVVTGAAQGFGYEIACDLAAQGAFVFLGDIREDGVRKAADSINDAQGRLCAMGLVMNVTDSASIRSALDVVVKRRGGLDVFISNAGVLKAGSVKTQPEAEFDFVTSVNYKGYYLCVQNVAPILAVQRLARADYFSDIIQINSKSGLQGSNRNFAYAGGKFGGLGLTQSFAMELVEDGIKVNSICPGNFFDGPLWSDPDNGLFVQYLRTGKVAGAKTVADVKKFYESKVPLGRGCRTGDVMKAIYYLMEQEYETGQAVPVTGGQVMLK